MGLLVSNKVAIDLESIAYRLPTYLVPSMNQNSWAWYKLSKPLNYRVTGSVALQHTLVWHNNGYKSYDFTRLDYENKGSFGGREKAGDKINYQPVVFIHGSSDTALKTSISNPGWDESISYFLDNGYSTAELYATTWRDHNEEYATARTHDCDTVIKVRKFLEAVIAYTKAPKIDVITHAMGVTLGRKAIKGGQLTTPNRTCNLGAPLTNKVDTFVGISGANYGWCNCEGWGEDLEKTCNRVNGFWPGNSCGPNKLDCGGIMLPCGTPKYSSFLEDLNSDPNREGTYVYSMYSTLDEVLLFGCKVWGRATPLIPGSTGEKVYSSHSHYGTKSKTAKDQYDMVVNHESS
uniref:Lipase n=1 Tax=Panagrellus redivivus TaxID=6233 RepID=A0A7E4ZW84_PANRE